uniref:Uncharacterized protein n=1 Tax=Lotus japonicus TaxID=34305 RepID=I3SSW4_LOTJA|nr:unknown [Lotus japonicus]
MRYERIKQPDERTLETLPLWDTRSPLTMGITQYSPANLQSSIIGLHPRGCGNHLSGHHVTAEIWQPMQIRLLLGPQISEILNDRRDLPIDA